MRSAALAALLASACYSPQHPALGDGSAGSDSGVTSGDRYSQVSVGARSMCAIGADDQGLYCWGDNTRGQVGIASSDPVVARPTRVLPQNKFSAVAVGGDHACALSPTDSTLYCWGTTRRVR